MKRVLTAVVLMAVLWIVIKRMPPIVFFGLVALGIAVACWECYRLFEARGDRPFAALGIAASVALAWSFLGAPPAFDPVLPLAVATALSFAAAMSRREDPDRMLRSAAGTLVPLLLIGLGLAFLVGLRSLPGDDGTDPLVLLLVCVICSDTAAFYVGTTLGRRRLAPTLSPRKTWEGAIGGVAASVGGALVAHFWFYQRLSLPHALALGVLIAVAGIGGDLAESAIKRAAGRKDSSRLLPGHGGILDRADSLLLAAPVLYYYYRAFLGTGP